MPLLQRAASDSSVAKVPKTRKFLMYRSRIKASIERAAGLGQDSLESQCDKGRAWHLQTHFVCIIQRAEVGQSPLIDRGAKEDQADHQQCGGPSWFRQPQLDKEGNILMMRFNIFREMVVDREGSWPRQPRLASALWRLLAGSKAGKARWGSESSSGGELRCRLERGSAQLG